MNRLATWSLLAVSLLLTMGVAPAAGRATHTRAATKATQGTPADTANDGPVTTTTPIEALFHRFEQRFLGTGGDRNVVIRLSAARGLTPPTRANGFLMLNLFMGDLVVFIQGLTRASDLYLVDNQPGKSFFPEEGDEIVRIARLQPRGNKILQTANLGRDFFRRFELDLAVVTRADASPIESQTLIGSRSTFERRFTRRRLGRRRRPSGPRSFANDPRVKLGLVSEEVLEGGELFFRATFDGNGRSCGTCHPAENNQAVDPVFIRRLRRTDPDNPLFIADPGRAGGVPRLEKPKLLERFGLFLENVDGLEDPTVKFTMRGVPHSLSMATSVTPPVPDENGNLFDGTTLTVEERTGWSGDGPPQPGILRLFPMGAIIQHNTRDLERKQGRDFRLPSDEELDDIEAFLLSVGRTNELNLAKVTLTDRSAESGRLLFSSNVGKCSGCHNNAGANFILGGNANFNNGNERVRIGRLDELNIPHDGGFGGRNLPDPNFDSNADGTNDSFGDGTFNVPPLVEAADTGPFFHTNASETIEDAVAFYSTDTFNNSPGGVVVQGIFGQGIALSGQQTQDIAAFLRLINAAFTLSIAIQRIEAAQRIDRRFGRSERKLTNGLLDLADEELKDARDVLGERDLNPPAHLLIKAAIRSIHAASGSTNGAGRKIAMTVARRLTRRAKTSLGRGLNFDMGEGNLVF